MKFRIMNIVILLFCFAWLALAAGAVPVLTGADSEEASAAPVSPEPPPSDTPAPSPTPVPTETPVPFDPGVTVIPITLTGDGLIDNHTYYDIDAQALLDEGAALTLPDEGYQILIIHTHTTEAYLPEAADLYDESAAFRTADTRYSVARVGEELASALSAYGLRVLHDEALYDYESYNGSYARSGEAIEAYLTAYPSIRLVIDLHRDALGTDETVYKTITEAEGIQAAQLLFVMGTDVNLSHPGWRDNLRLALTLESLVWERYPTLMRPASVVSYRYNQQLTPGSLLLEVGTTGNTLQEAINAVKLFADAVGPYLVSCVE